MQYFDIGVITLLNIYIIFSYIAPTREAPDYKLVFPDRFNLSNYIAVFIFNGKPICTGTAIESYALITSCACMKYAMSKEVLKNYTIKWGHYTFDGLNYTARISSIHKSCPKSGDGFVIVKTNVKLETLIELPFDNDHLSEEAKYQKCFIVFWSFHTDSTRLKTTDFFYVKDEFDDVPTLYNSDELHRKSCADIGSPIVCNGILLGIIQKRDNCYSGIIRDHYLQVTPQKNWIKRKLEEKGCNKSAIFNDFWFFLIFSYILVLNCVN